MRRIEIDDDVYAWLEARVKGFEAPNDVLRRELLGAQEAVTYATPAPVTVERGSLYILLEAGLVEEGDTLSCHRTRQGVTYRGTVEGDGYIRTELGRFKAPSPALKAFVKSEIDGWASWMHDRSQTRLRDLRSQAGGGPSRPVEP